MAKGMTYTPVAYVNGSPTFFYPRDDGFSPVDGRDCHASSGASPVLWMEPSIDLMISNRTGF